MIGGGLNVKDAKDKDTDQIKDVTVQVTDVEATPVSDIAKNKSVGKISASRF